MDDWDGVELGPEVAELPLVPAKGKYDTVYCYTHNTHMGIVYSLIGVNE